MPVTQNPRQPVGAKLLVAPGFANVPATPTVLTDQDATFFAAYVNNPTGDDITLTIEDGTGEVLGPVEIAGGTFYAIELDWGMQCNGGVTWGASGAGLRADLIIATRIGA